LWPGPFGSFLVIGAMASTEALGAVALGEPSSARPARLRIAGLSVFLALVGSSLVPGLAWACPVRGRALPEMQLIVCPTMATAQAFSRVAMNAMPAEGCQLSEVQFEAYRAERSVQSFQARVLSWWPASAFSVEHRYDGKVNRIPLRLSEQRAWIWYGSITLRSGEIVYGWAILPEQMYHPAFLGLPCSGRPR